MIKGGSDLFCLLFILSASLVGKNYNVDDVK